jgi:hypothetical protein
VQQLRDLWRLEMNKRHFGCQREDRILVAEEVKTSQEQVLSVLQITWDSLGLRAQKFVKTEAF